MHPGFRITTAGLALALITTLATTGCSKSPTEPPIAHNTPSGPAPPTTPTEAVQNLAYAMNHRDATTYGQLFTNDFEFSFSPYDQAGGEFIDGVLSREQEMTIADHMFVSGTSSGPPKATRIELNLGPIVVNPDSRAGKDPTMHKEVLISFTIAVEAGEQQWSTLGTTRFFLVRGDAADVADKNAGRWWIERWEDDRNPPHTTLRAATEPVPTPTQEVWWGTIKALYQ